jgi:hypothetical protein
VGYARVTKFVLELAVDIANRPARPRVYSERVTCPAS